MSWDSWRLGLHAARAANNAMWQFRDEGRCCVCACAHYLLCGCTVLLCCTLLCCTVGLSATIKSKFILQYELTKISQISDFNIENYIVLACEVMALSLMTVTVHYITDGFWLYHAFFLLFNFWPFIEENLTLSLLAGAVISLSDWLLSAMMLLPLKCH